MLRNKAINHVFKVVLFFNLVSCNGLDNDDRFLYSLKSSFLISQTSKIFQCYEQADTLKIQPFLQNIYEGNIIENQVYFLDTTARKWLAYRVPFEMASEKSYLQNFFLISGWKSFKVLANDNEILLENENQSLRIPHGAKYLFCNQGRLWAVQKRKVNVYDLKAGAALDSFPLQKDFLFADFNRGFYLFVYTYDSTGLYQKTFDTNGISTGNETKVNFQRIQHTKVLSRLYETEYLKNVELNAQNNVNIPNFTEEVHSFDMDFQGGRLFYTRNDSLFVFHVNTLKKQFLLANFGILKKGLHFYSQ